MRNNQKINFAFFGTPDVASETLEILKQNGYIPSLIITSPDAKRGRGLHLQASPVALFAEKNNIPYLKPEKLLSNIEKSGGEVKVAFEVGKSTHHHKSGEVFHADCLIKINGKEFYSSADKEDLYQAIDAIKDSLYSEINRNKDRSQTLLYRGARSIKKMMKGLSKRNPFTSKY